MNYCHQCYLLVIVGLVNVVDLSKLWQISGASTIAILHLANDGDAIALVTIGHRR